MRPSTPLDFPGSRYVAAWWKQLAPLRPRALWAAHFLLHRVEALARTSRVIRPDGATHLLLQAVAPGATAAALEARLCVRRQVVGRLLRQLLGEGLLENTADDRWGLTPLGRAALEQGAYARAGCERRPFHFVENESGRPPHFLNLSSGGVPWAADDGWTFDLGVLRDGAARPAEWKERHGFPADVVEVLDETAAAPWQAVAVDRPGYLAAAVVLTPAEPGERLVGYAVNPDGWDLRADPAAFAVADGWRDAFPDLAAEPAPEVWREAWGGWCQRRGLPTVEAEACALERHEYRVRVRAPGRLLDRLRAARSEALKGEAWLLAVTGRVRAAAQIELQTS